MKQGKCEKYKSFFWLEKHHILPKSTFDENDEIIYLCPNCHTDYHQKLGRENLKNPNPQFHFDFYNKWLLGAICLAFVMMVYWWL